MAKKDRPSSVTEKEGFILEWFSRRGELDVNIYKKNSDGTKGSLISELVYPKIKGTGPADWEPEAVSIAKSELEKQEEARKE